MRQQHARDLWSGRDGETGGAHHPVAWEERARESRVFMREEMVKMDATLSGRLSAATVPIRVIWGDHDRIADPDYGRAYATAIPIAEFVLLTETGHMPPLETPKGLLPTGGNFADTHARNRRGSATRIE